MLYLPDANILINTLRKNSPQHDECREWLVSAVNIGDEIGLSELVEAALLRIPTLPKFQWVPVADTLRFWREDLLRYPGTRRLHAGNAHTEFFSKFVTSLKLTGNDMNDAWLAALAMEHRATLVSTDAGFARFRGLRWHNPAAK